MRLGEVEHGVVRSTRLPSGKILWTVHDKGTVGWSIDGISWKPAGRRLTVGAVIAGSECSLRNKIDRAVWGIHP